jgi:hypothetical protein
MEVYYLVLGPHFWCQIGLCKLRQILSTHTFRPPAPLRDAALWLRARLWPPRRKLGCQRQLILTTVRLVLLTRSAQPPLPIGVELAETLPFSKSRITQAIPPRRSVDNAPAFAGSNDSRCSPTVPDVPPRLNGPYSSRYTRDSDVGAHRFQQHDNGPPKMRHAELYARYFLTHAAS